MFIITSIGVIVGLATLIVILYNDKRSKIQRIVDSYIQNTIQYSGEGWDFLIKAGALKLSNRDIQNVCREIEKRGCENPFASFPDVKGKKNFKKTLQAYLDKENKESEGNNFNKQQERIL